jgi:hypothetical protein
VVLVAILVIACGTKPSGGTTSSSSAARLAQSPEASASAIPSGQERVAPVLLVVVTTAPSPDQPGSIRLYHEDGSAAATIALQAGSGVLAVGGTRIFVRRADGAMQAIGENGSAETLEPPGTLTGIGGLVSSPDGASWLWASQTSDTTSQSIHIGGDAAATRRVATFAYPTVLTPFAWTSQGIFLDSLPMDFMGYRPFNTTFGAFGGVRLLDPAKGTIEPITAPADCFFSDEANGGMIACFPADAHQLVPNRHALRIVNSNGKVMTLPLSVPRFNYVGDAYFSPDETILTVAGATGVGAYYPGSATVNTKPEQYGTDLVATGNASIWRFGPTGTRPAMGRQSWLPDGHLVLWRPDAFGGAPGLYILDPHGTGVGPELEVTGIPVGYLTG